MQNATPRGIRNNNPGNLREPPDSGDQWDGERDTDDDPAFEEFESAEYGIRALAKVLLRYYRFYGLDTVSKIIHRWAPPSENDTVAYAAAVADRMGVGADVMISLNNSGLLELLVRAIIQHENGVQPYDDETILAGLQLALE